MFLLLTAALAHAEDAAFVGTAAVAEAKKPETHVKANVGGTLTAGNSESVSINAGFDLSHKWTRNQLGVVGGAAIGFGAVDANGDGFLASTERCIGVAGATCAATTQRATVDARYDRFVSDRSSLYVLVGVLHDKFAGYDLRSHGQLGYAFHPVDTERTQLKVEAGVDVANEDYVDGVEPASTRLIAAQLGAKLSHSFNENVGFTDEFTVYEPVLSQPAGAPLAPYFTDLRIANVATISAKLSDKLSLSLSDSLTWRNEPVAAPDGIAESRSNVDNTLTVALVASLL